MILNGPSLFPYLQQGEDRDYQPVGSMADLERQELNYPALEFQGTAPGMGGPQGGGMTAGKNRDSFGIDLGAVADVIHIYLNCIVG